MKILFYTNIPSPYRVDFFNELGKYCELTVLFERKSSSERDKAWDQFEFKHFTGIIMKGKKTSVDSAFCPSVVRYLKKDAYDYIFVSVLASFTAFLMAAVLRIKGISYFYEGDGGFTGDIKGCKAFVKRFIISGAKLCFSTSMEFDKYCVAYGALKENVVRYPFTSVLAKDIVPEEFSETQKKALKKKFGIMESVAMVSVGQMIFRKGFDMLLEISKSLPENVGVYIIGGKPTKELLRYKQENNLQHVHFMEFMPYRCLLDFYRAMDFFVLLTREDIWGLVVNEAMANGLPVVSTNRCLAAIEMIRNDYNGIVVPIDRKDEMKKALQYLCENRGVREKMAKNARFTIKEHYTIETMAGAHMEILKRYGSN